MLVCSVISQLFPFAASQTLHNKILLRDRRLDKCMEGRGERERVSDCVDKYLNWRVNQLVGG